MTCKASMLDRMAVRLQVYGSDMSEVMPSKNI